MPVSMSVEYFLGDHLGSTSITTDNTGAKVSEMRYKPCPLAKERLGMLREGEVRYSWTSAPVTTPSYKLSAYTFTGQYSYMDDPSTSGVTEGFGLMFYNARWYDPSLGRFAQADSIVPNNIQGLDRYSYTFNNPINFIDPSGHVPVDCFGGDGYCGSSKMPSVIKPDHIDREMLKKTKYGEEVYDFYVRLFNDPDGWWWQTYGSDGNFSALEFIGMMYGYELDVVVSDPTHYNDAYPLYIEAMVRNSREYCEVSGCDASTLTGAFMHLSYYSESTQNRAESNNPDMYILNSDRITGGADLVSAIRNPSNPEWNEGFSRDRPYSVGNQSLHGAPNSWMYEIGGGNPMYILSGCQSLDYWGYKDLYKAWGCN